MPGAGVTALRTSLTVPNAVATSVTGDATVLPSHLVDIDIESFPTGIAMPSVTHRSLAAFTAAYRRASSPACPAAAIQLQLSFTFDSAPTGAPARFVIAS